MARVAYPARARPDGPDSLMATSSAVREMRVALSAGVVTPVKPPGWFSRVLVGNGTSGDVTLFTNDDQSEFRVITAGFEREISLPTQRFHPEEIAFWLKAASSGTVICEWT